jgi:hypothetical protein
MLSAQRMMGRGSVELFTTPKQLLEPMLSHGLCDRQLLVEYPQHGPLHSLGRGNDFMLESFSPPIGSRLRSLSCRFCQLVANSTPLSTFSRAGLVASIVVDQLRSLLSCSFCY